MGFVKIEGCRWTNIPAIVIKSLTLTPILALKFLFFLYFFLFYRNLIRLTIQKGAMLDSNIYKKRAQNATFRMPVLMTLFFATLVLSLIYFLEYELTLIVLFLPLWTVAIGILIYILLIAVPGWMIGYPLGLLMGLLYERVGQRTGEIVTMLKANGIDQYPFHQIGLFASVPIMFIFISLHKSHFGTVFDTARLGSYLVYGLALLLSFLLHDIIDMAVQTVLLAVLPGNEVD